MVEVKWLMKFVVDEGVNRMVEEYVVFVFFDNEFIDEEKVIVVEFLEVEVEEGMSYFVNYVLVVFYINGEFVEKDMVKVKFLLVFLVLGKYVNLVELF